LKKTQAKIRRGWRFRREEHAEIVSQQRRQTEAAAVRAEQVLTHGILYDSTNIVPPMRVRLVLLHGKGCAGPERCTCTIAQQRIRCDWAAVGGAWQSDDGPLGIPAAKAWELLKLEEA
jgi:hypothetical protein